MRTLCNRSTEVYQLILSNWLTDLLNFIKLVANQVTSAIPWWVWLLVAAVPVLGLLGIVVGVVIVIYKFSNRKHQSKVATTSQHVHLRVH